MVPGLSNLAALADAGFSDGDRCDHDGNQYDMIITCWPKTFLAEYSSSLAALQTEVTQALFRGAEGVEAVRAATAFQLRFNLTCALLRQVRELTCQIRFAPEQLSVCSRMIPVPDSPLSRFCLHQADRAGDTVVLPLAAQPGWNAAVNLAPSTELREFLMSFIKKLFLSMADEFHEEHRACFSRLSQAWCGVGWMAAVPLADAREAAMVFHLQLGSSVEWSNRQSSGRPWFMAGMDPGAGSRIGLIEPDPGSLIIVSEVSDRSQLRKVLTTLNATDPSESPLAGGCLWLRWVKDGDTADFHWVFARDEIRGELLLPVSRLKQTIPLIMNRLQSFRQRP